MAAFISKMSHLLQRNVCKNKVSPFLATNNQSLLFQAARHMSSSKIFIGGLSYSTNDMSLREACSPYGQVIDRGVAGGHSEQKLVMGFSDETKDQLTSENSIPLSPQWLYAKPSDAKIGPSVASEHTEQYRKEEKRFEEEEITQFQKFDYIY